MCGVPGRDAASIAESQGFRRVLRVGPQKRDRVVMCPARAFWPPPGSRRSRRGVLPVRPDRSCDRTPGPAPGQPPGRAPDLAAGTSAPGYFKMLTARATISATVMMEMTDCRAMASFAQRDSGITSAGLNADALVKAR